MSKKQFYNNDLKSNFFKVPNSIFDLDIPLTDLKVYLFLISQGESFTPGIRSLSTSLNMNKTTVNKSIKRLIESGLILFEKQRNPKGKPRFTYSIVPWSVVLANGTYTKHYNNISKSLVYVLSGGTSKQLNESVVLLNGTTKSVLSQNLTKKENPEEKEDMPGVPFGGTTEVIHSARFRPRSKVST